MFKFKLPGHKIHVQSSRDLNIANKHRRFVASAYHALFTFASFHLPFNGQDCLDFKNLDYAHDINLSVSHPLPVQPYSQDQGRTGIRHGAILTNTFYTLPLTAAGDGKSEGVSWQSSEGRFRFYLRIGNYCP